LPRPPAHRQALPHSSQHDMHPGHWWHIHTQPQGGVSSSMTVTPNEREGAEGSWEEHITDSPEVGNWEGTALRRATRAGRSKVSLSQETRNWEANSESEVAPDGKSFSPQNKPATTGNHSSWKGGARPPIGIPRCQPHHGRVPHGGSGGHFCAIDGRETNR
jgi:hypothetical protein